MKPLSGKTILITRPRKDSESFVRAVEDLGGRPVVIPMIRITDPDSWEECDSAINAIERYDGLVFASRNAVSQFCSRCEAMSLQPSSIVSKAIYAVGEKTKKAVEAFGLPVRFVPDDYSLSSLATHFTAKDVFGKKYLLVRGNIGKEELALRLRKLGALVDVVVAYKTEQPDQDETKALLSMLASGDIDVVTFASPSAVRHFSEMVPRESVGSVLAAVIGPTTGEAASKAGWKEIIQAEQSTVEALVQAVVQHYEELKEKDHQHL